MKSPSAWIIASIRGLKWEYTAVTWSLLKFSIAAAMACHKESRLLWGFLLLTLPTTPQTKQSRGFRSSEFGARSPRSTTCPGWLQLIHDDTGSVHQCGVLLEDVWPATSNFFGPGLHHLLEDLQVGVLVDRFTFPEEVWRHDVAETGDDCDHHDRFRVLRHHLDGNVLWVLAESFAIVPVNLAVDHKKSFRRWRNEYDQRLRGWATIASTLTEPSVWPSAEQWAGGGSPMSPTALWIVVSLTLSCCASFLIETDGSSSIRTSSYSRKAASYIVSDLEACNFLADSRDCPDSSNCWAIRYTVNLDNFKKFNILTGERPARSATMTIACWSYSEAIFKKKNCASNTINWTLFPPKIVSFNFFIKKL